MTDLKASIQQYETQLKQVVEALKHAKDNAEAESLRSLKSDLEELVELTRQTLQQDPDGTESGSSASNSNGYDDEMALFMSEIKSLEATGPAASSTAPNNCDTNEKLDTKLRVIKDELQAMVGKKCSAPHDHAWGARTYHNAIVCSMDDTRDYELADIKEFRVRILFTNPTHKEMIPCGYFLDGNCKFDVEKCRFSHGELVPVGELKDYKEPEFHKLKRNCIVLAKMYDKLWHKGRVLCVNVVEKSCRVRLEQQKKDVDFNFEDLFPIFHDDDQSSGSSDSEDEADIADLRNAYLIEKSLLTPAADQALGEWEKHTRGIGSQLMQKMGYIIGTGLGSTGSGIITPISAQILPPGRSLDHCMELREAANGDKNLFSVERKMKIAKKKQDAINTKLYERTKNKTDIFSFLNDNILTTSSTKPDGAADKAPLMRNEYKNHTLKNLNVESLKIGDDIRRKEREIQKLQESMRRHTAGSDIHKKMQGQMAIKSNELSCLRKSESNITREQTLRKHKDKLSVF